MEQPSTNTPQPVPEAGLVRQQALQWQARLRPMVQIAAVLIDKVRLQAILAGGAGLWLWGWLFFPFSAFGKGWVLALGVGALALLMTPAGVLFLFWAGLRELIGVPDKLLEMAGEGETQTEALLETVSRKTEQGKARRLWRFFRTVLDLRSLILGSKELLLKFAVVARIANPVFIGVLFVAFVLSLLLIFVAAVSMMVVIF